MKKLSMLIFVVLIISAIIPLVNIIKIYPLLFGQAPKVKSKAPVYRAVIISAHLGDPYWDEIIEGAKAEAKSNSINLDVEGSYRANPEEIKKAMEVAIASNVDGMILVGLEEPRFGSIIDKATVKGIPVFTVGADIPTSLRKAYIGTNHEQSGKLVASNLRKLFSTSEKIGVVSLNQDSDIEEERWKGLFETLSKTHEHIYQYTNGDSPSIETQTRELLNQYPDLKIFVTMGPNTEEKVIDAIEERYSMNGIKIFSFDDTKKARELLSSGEINGVLLHSRLDMGKKSIQLLAQWLNKENLPLPTHVYTDIQFIEDKKS
ncbi:sugar ABC transporter substrate-binding protein [Falsibacillus albus]|nr:substrate-binding domain-containing protein [Falsibacillus albus]